MGTAYSALTGLNVIIGLFSSLAVNMPDFGRFSKNRLAGGHQFMALPIIGTLGALTPIFVTSANQYLYGEFQWYMPLVIANWESRAAKFFVGAAFILATIGNQIAAGSYPFSNDISGFAPKYINIFRGTLFMWVVSLSGTRLSALVAYHMMHHTSLAARVSLAVTIIFSTESYANYLFRCIFCVVSTPWNIIKNAAGLLAFLSGYR
jgi:NCS1 family nucleobase:cation symporter-1